MHHCMPQSRTGWPSLNVGFPPVMCLIMDDPKEIIDQTHELVLEDRWISAKSIDEQLGSSCERFGSITHEDSDMPELSAKWVPKCLTWIKKHQRCQTSKQLLEFFWCDPNDFLSQLVTMDKTWLYHCDQETKQQSMEWQHSGSPCPKKF